MLNKLKTLGEREKRLQCFMEKQPQFKKYAFWLFCNTPYDYILLLVFLISTSIITSEIHNFYNCYRQ